MNGPKVIAYDLGTGGIKASLFSAAGEILESVFISYPTHFPQPDWQEQAPDDWWNAVVRSTRELLKKSGVSPDEIVSLAISGHSLGVVPIGKQGQLLRRTTPIWSDQRAVREVEEFFSRTDYRAWYERTGNGFPPACYSVFKIMWYRTHEPEMFAAIDRVIGTKDYCNYRLTGRLCTDASYASGSGVFDLRAWEYEPAYIQAAGLDSSIFPEILPSDAVVGTLTEEAARETGLNPRTKVMAGGVDNSCMALGAGGIRAGEIYTSLGSSAWIAAIGDAPVIGAGSYADNASCAVSCTGHGEYFIRHAVAFNVCARYKYLKESVREAADYIIHQELNKDAGNGGLIAVDKDGNIAMPFNSGGMFRGYLYKEKGSGAVVKKVGIGKEMR